MARTYDVNCFFFAPFEAEPSAPPTMADNALDAFSSANAGALVVEWGQRFEARAIQQRERFRRLTEHLSGTTDVVWFYRTNLDPGLATAPIETFYDLMPEFDIQVAAQRHAERLAAFSAAHPDRIDVDMPIDFDGADW
jgi:hypothetical protein